EGREDHDVQFCERGVVDDAARRFEPVDARHADVHQGDVGNQLVREVRGFGAVAGFADDFDVWLGVEQGAKTGAHEQLVVGEQDTDKEREGAGGRASRRPPPPGARPISNAPPSAAARSRMPTMPLPPLGAASGASPCPLSSTATTTESSLYVTCICA